MENENEKNGKGGRQWRAAEGKRERELAVERCVGGKETDRERKTDGDLKATVTPGLVCFIQSSRH